MCHNLLIIAQNPEKVNGSIRIIACYNIGIPLAKEVR